MERDKDRSVTGDGISSVSGAQLVSGYELTV